MDRVLFEIVQRVGPGEGDGGLNAAARRAAQA
jgi:hypothetical protein